jgi:hypothetical protein
MIYLIQQIIIALNQLNVSPSFLYFLRAHISRKMAHHIYTRTMIDKSLHLTSHKSIVQVSLFILKVWYKYLTSQLHVSYNSLSSLLQVSYKSLTSLLQVSYMSLTSLLRVSYKSCTSLIHPIFMGS